jgi:hypothetical protein
LRAIGGAGGAPVAVAKPPLAVAPLPYALALSPFALLLTPTAVALAPVVIAPGPIETALVLGGLAVPPPAVYWAAAGLATAATPAAITRPLSAPPASALVESSARWECGRSVAGEAARLAETKLPENRFCSVAINESPPLPESESATTMSQRNGAVNGALAPQRAVTSVSEQAIQKCHTLPMLTLVSPTVSTP